ncbi:type II toxin-antitoxin system VapC family toxin [Saccharopolyspora sp. K220]|uniref:type II toxin-antitoxin system VapC family toxin n=1 Tax=Saccharopolyspora soli TaxID=2926618 RepID=UPI001F57CCC6|nr:type II toxin-antitoxin system VapC family toxin [Saccharopolyspora soli]MCI2419875.1 type II toxin-antitoxin system VapC family toxin [Saccharopolyspora soli]
MNELAVVDASAAVFALADPSPAADELATRLAGAECHAPHLVDAEVGNMMRRNLRQGIVDEETAASVIRATRSLVDRRYAHAALVDTAWELRGAITFYDALYVALAASLDVPLLTADAKLSRAPKLPCKVEVVG